MCALGHCLSSLISLETITSPQAGKVDLEAALEHFQSAAEEGNPSAQYGLAYMYLVGEGVDEDHDKALKLFTSVSCGERGRLIGMAFIVRDIQDLVVCKGQCPCISRWGTNRQRWKKAAAASGQVAYRHRRQSGKGYLREHHMYSAQPGQIPNHSYLATSLVTISAFR
jgi:hypothetical protein